MAATSRLSERLTSLVRVVEQRLPPGPLVVALSGGADSAALAWIVAGTDRAVRAMTVDHGLKGSGELVAAAASIAARLGLEHRVIAVDAVEGEAALRRVRLEALEGALRPGETLLTAHTSDDQAETVLGNLLRGSGTLGLAGIPRSRGRFARPLLDVSRRDARRIATNAGLPYHDDPQNRDLDVRRNRLRTETIPALERDFNPALRRALGAAAQASAEDDRMLARLAARVPVRRSEEAVVIPAAALSTAPAAVASRVARRALRVLLHPYAGLRRDVEAILTVARDGGRRSVSGGHLVVSEGPLVALHPVGDLDPPPAVELPVPGEVAFGPWTITATSFTGGPFPLGHMGAVIATGGPLRVRAARPGDEVAIAAGSKRVSEALRESGVPERLRPRWPVAETDGRIAWVVGARVASWAVPTEGGTLLRATREVA